MREAVDHDLVTGRRRDRIDRLHAKERRRFERRGEARLERDHGLDPRGDHRREERTQHARSATPHFGDGTALVAAPVDHERLSRPARLDQRGRQRWADDDLPVAGGDPTLAQAQLDGFADGIVAAQAHRSTACEHAREVGRGLREQGRERERKPMRRSDTRDELRVDRSGIVGEHRGDSIFGERRQRHILAERHRRTDELCRLPRLRRAEEQLLGRREIDRR